MNPPARPAGLALLKMSVIVMGVLILVGLGAVGVAGTKWVRRGKQRGATETTQKDEPAKSDRELAYEDKLDDELDRLD